MQVLIEIADILFITTNSILRKIDLKKKKIVTHPIDIFSRSPFFLFRKYTFF